MEFFLEWNLRKKKKNKLRFDECGLLRYSKGSSYLAEHQFGKQKVKIGAGYLFKSKNSKDRLLLPHSKTKCIYVIKINWGFYILVSHKLMTDSCYGYILIVHYLLWTRNFFLQTSLSCSVSQKTDLSSDVQKDEVTSFFSSKFQL